MAPHIHGFERWIEVHAHDGRIGVLAEFAFDDSFTARTPEFRAFARDLALQVAAMAPVDVDALMAQDFVKSPGTAIAEYLRSTAALLGDRLSVVRFERWVAAPERPFADGGAPPHAPGRAQSIARGA